ncbi:23S rRNA (adenine(2030)-N(6))-methyltransferase RlmJ [uncultured Treponema sp.]|uniref:23S rRNA (adenine(2030)-N(6))-methyltransferase RlmJ n=3 Tax=Treponema TaxID=157 RepID=UPI002635E821|nr:23S rRNA (adenine(2030)-N(6))-methyltransferase RlmJ [uncultured Treponema sp.]
MLSYIHAYHAGNHADILKHLTLSMILDHLCKKEKPFTVIDTHAGSGLYALDDSRALKTGEAKSGIEKMINSSQSPQSSQRDSTGENDFPLKNDLCALKSSVRNLKFFDIIQKYYEKSLYPGSPLIENIFLRPGDEQLLCELHPTAFEELKNCFYNRRKECKASGKNFVEPALHKRDGYEFLKAVTPPKIKRGLAIIDPSFEDASDFEKCGEVISAVHKKWPAGIIALWYPLVAHRTSEISMMKERIAARIEASEPKILDIQMEIKRKEDMTGLASLYGSGMFIVNFPYQLDEEMKALLPDLSKVLADTAGDWSVEKR